MYIETNRAVFDRISPEASNRLSRLLDGIVKGNDEVLVTPMAERVSPEDIFVGWLDIFDDNAMKMNGPLRKLESEQISKYGPRSIAVPWSERIDGVLDYFNVDQSNSLEQKCNDVSSSITVENPHRLRPLSRENALKYIKRNTNAGLPTLQKKGTAILNNEIGSPDEWPCVPFTRTQENEKTRTVWGYPLADVLDEMRFYRPILVYQRDKYYRAALRKAEDIDRAVTALIDFALLTKRQLISIDFSGYDASVGPALQGIAFYYFELLFQNNYREELILQSSRFRSIPLVTPNGTFIGNHGIPSGSAYTNEVGSVSQHYVAHSFTEEIKFDQQQGDDGIYAVYNSEGFRDHFRSFGLDVNDDKSYVTDDYVVYLQNLYHVDYRDETGIIHGIYPTFRALCRLVYQERFNDFSKFDMSGVDYYGIRTLSILETCKYHPLFEEFVTYIWGLDKYKLNVSDQGISAYVRMREIQDGKDVRFTEYKRGDSTSIKDFASYKLVAKLNGK